MTQLATEFRTHTCGDLRLEHAQPPKNGDAPERVTLSGRVDRRLDHDAILLRDHYGQTLVTADPEAEPYVRERLEKVGPEDVVRITGIVVAREDGADAAPAAPAPPTAPATDTGAADGAGEASDAAPAAAVDAAPAAPEGPRFEKDPDLPTGEVYLRAAEIEILSESAGLPDDVLSVEEVSADARLEYRQLYLRRPEVQTRMALRSRTAHALREFLVANDFLELETPQLFWYDPVATDPETVPVSPRQAFALPGGPVVLDQYILAGQFDRFFQFLQITGREDDPGPLHQPEFTGLDINMEYVDATDLWAKIEEMLASVWKTVKGEELPTPFLQISYADCMVRFGTDKPDARYGLDISDLPDAAPEGQTLRGFCIPNSAGALPDGVLDQILAPLNPQPPDPDAEPPDPEAPPTFPPAPALLSWGRVGAGGAALSLRGAATISADAASALPKALDAKAGDIIVVAHSEEADSAAKAAGTVRVEAATRLGLAKGPARAVWVHTYPFMAKHEGDWALNVVVFSALADQKDLDRIMHRPEERRHVRSRAFDLVVNGIEMSTGYMGNHDIGLQMALYTNLHQMELSDLFRLRAPVESHRFGVPPHGGLTLGFDRLVALLAESDAIAEVIPFPKTQECVDPLLRAPGPVPKEAVADLLDEPELPYTIDSIIAEAKEDQE